MQTLLLKKIGDRLKSLYNDNKGEYIRCWEDVGTFVKYGALRDDKFKKQVEDLIIFRTTYEANQGEEKAKVEVQSGDDDAWSDVKTDESYPYTTLKEYLERNKAKHENRVFYTTNAQTQSTYIDLYKNQGIEVLYMDSFIDNNYFIPFLEREYTDVKFSRVDSELDSNLVEEDKAGEIVNPQTNKTRADEIKEIFEKAINKPKVNIKTQSLKAEKQEETPPPQWCCYLKLCVVSKR